MTDTFFVKVLDELELLHREFPDLRLGEVIQGSVDKKKATNNKCLHDISSKELLVAVENFRAETREKRGG